MSLKIYKAGWIFASAFSINLCEYYHDTISTGIGMCFHGVHLFKNKLKMVQNKLNDLAGKFGKVGQPSLTTRIKLLADVGIQNETWFQGFMND